jgi:uncharacterized protein (TIGR01777 family)
VVNLAGTGLADRRWTDSRKQELRNSRLKSTDLLSRRLAELSPRPSVLVSGSALGYYGSRGDERLNEQSGPGQGFLVDLVQDWEAATAPAEEAGIRVAHIRTGIVQSPTGGALKRQLPLFRLGLGGRLAAGRQYWSWIALEDEVGAIIHVLLTDALSGPVNLTAPHPVTNAEYTTTLGRVLHRPTLLPVPRFALALALGGELADEALVGGARVFPDKLEQSGYRFQHPELQETFESLLRTGGGDR